MVSGFLYTTVYLPTSLLTASLSICLNLRLVFAWPNGYALGAEGTCCYCEGLLGRPGIMVLMARFRAMGIRMGITVHIFVQRVGCLSLLTSPEEYAKGREVPHDTTLAFVAER